MTLVTKVFDDAGEHAALTAAAEWLKARGFSVGPTVSRSPIGVMLGECNIAAWSKLSSEDIADLHGRLTTPTLSYRSGPVTLTIRPDAPGAVFDALRSEEQTAAPNLASGAAAPVHFMFGPNGMVAAFSANGEQVPEWQGTRMEIVTKLARLLGPDVRVEEIGGAL